MAQLTSWNMSLERLLGHVFPLIQLAVVMESHRVQSMAAQSYPFSWVCS